MKLPRILIVDDQLATNGTERLLFLEAVGLSANSYAEVEFCSGQRRDGNLISNDPQIIVDAVREGSWSLVLLDFQFDSGIIDADGRILGQTGDENFGLDIYQCLKHDFPELPVVMLSGKRHQEIGEDGGGVPYLSKHGLSAYQLRRTLAVYGKLEPEVLRSILQLDADVIAQAPNSLEVFQNAYQYAKSGTSMLLLGESGVGKEVLAKYLHRTSERAGPFVPVNVAAIPRDLVESELFGIGPQVATGVSEHVGKFEQATGGTLFLDEIGDMPLDTQAKVLRALEERKIVRVGESREIEIDIRLICATSRDLVKLTEAGTFREDLLYRINTVPLTIPPLRNRREDIAPLACQLLNDFGLQQSKTGLSLSHKAIALIEAQPYTGNVRELVNLIERLVSAAGHYQVIDITAVQNALSASSGKVNLASESTEERGAGIEGSDACIEELINAIRQFRIDAGVPDLKSAKTRLDLAYQQLIQRLAGAALERCRDPVSGSLNRQKAMQLLTGDESLRGKGPGRVINQIIGRRLDEKITENDLETLINQGRYHR